MRKRSVFNFQILQGTDDGIFGRLQYFPTDDDLIQNAIDFMKVKDNIQFADVTEILVEVLHEEMNKLAKGNLTSRCRSSLSLISMHTAKYNPWYLLYTILKLWNCVFSEIPQ